jgi:hypothetical protein
MLGRNGFFRRGWEGEEEIDCLWLIFLLGFMAKWLNGEVIRFFLSLGLMKY